MATDLLTGEAYHRLAKMFPFEAKFDDEARYITETTQKSENCGCTSQKNASLI